MGRGRLEAFSDGVILAILATLYSPWIAEAILVAVALIWLIPDRRIESVLPRDAA